MWVQYVYENRGTPPHTANSCCFAFGFPYKPDKVSLKKATSSQWLGDVPHKDAVARVAGGTSEDLSRFGDLGENWGGETQGRHRAQKGERLTKSPTIHVAMPSFTLERSYMLVFVFFNIEPTWIVWESSFRIQKLWLVSTLIAKL